VARGGCSDDELLTLSIPSPWIHRHQHYQQHQHHQDQLQQQQQQQLQLRHQLTPRLLRLVMILMIPMIALSGCLALSGCFLHNKSTTKVGILTEDPVISAVNSIHCSPTPFQSRVNNTHENFYSPRSWSKVMLTV